MGTIRFIKLDGDDDGEVLQELPWFEDPMDSGALKRTVTEEAFDSLKWKGAAGVQAVRAMDDDGKPGARYTWWDFQRDQQSLAQARIKKTKEGKKNA
jgi:hypothetical protein